MGKGKISKVFKYFFTIILAAILLALSIDAAENYGKPSRSVIEKLIFGQAEKLCPDDMAYVSSPDKGFCVDKFENSPASNCPYANPVNSEESRANLDMLDCRPVSVVGAMPWRNISPEQAANACARAGKRLPTPREWSDAVLGTPDQKSGWTPDDCQVNKNWITQPGLTGSGKNCISGVGAYDMVGNVWEWVSGEITDGNYQGRKLPEEGYISSVNSDSLPETTNLNQPSTEMNEDFLWIKTSGQRMIARGGYWDNKSDAGQNSLYLVYPPKYFGTGVGFRCVK